MAVLPVNTNIVVHIVWHMEGENFSIVIIVFSPTNKQMMSNIMNFSKLLIYGKFFSTYLWRILKVIMVGWYRLVYHIVTLLLDNIMAGCTWIC